MGLGSSDQLCYSARLMQPFARTLATYPGVPAEWIANMQSFGPDDRVPIAMANQMLEIAITATGDPLLPLKAGRAATVGDAGALDYVMSSSATVQDAFDAARRYMRLVNDALSVQVHVEGDVASVRMVTSIPASADVEDFGMVSFFNNCVRRVLGDVSDLEVCLIHIAPADLHAHQAAFDGARLSFGNTWSGYRFAATRLSQPVATADATLNEILRAHLDRTLSELPAAHSLIERTRQLIRRDLPRGRATAPLIARELSMSRRTLCRRLEADKTSFSDLLDDVRRVLALDHVAQGQLALSEIAFLLGFAQTAGFHRAFKRWTNQTPVEYRAQHR